MHLYNQRNRYFILKVICQNEDSDAYENLDSVIRTNRARREAFERRYNGFYSGEKVGVIKLDSDIEGSIFCVPMKRVFSTGVVMQDIVDVEKCFLMVFANFNNGRLFKDLDRHRNPTEWTLHSYRM